MSEKNGKRDPWPSLSAIRPKSGWDPAARSHWEADTAKGKPPDRRIMGWVHLHTVCGRPPLREGADYLRSPFCVDDKDRVLTLKHCEDDLDMDHSLLNRTWSKLVAEGRVRQEEGKLYLGIEIEAAEDGRNSGEQNQDCTVLNDLFPEEIVNLWKTWPRERLECFATQFWAEEAWFKQAHKEAMSALRNIRSERQDSLLEKWGLPKSEKQPKLRKEHPEAVTLLRPLYDRTVQSSTGTIQSEKPGLYTAENGTVQSDISFMYSKLKVQSFEAPSSPAHIKDQPPPPTLKVEQNGGGGPHSNSNGYGKFCKHCKQWFQMPGSLRLWERLKQNFGDAPTEEILANLPLLPDQESPGLWLSFSAEALRAMNGQAPKKLTRSEKLAAEVLAEMRAKSAGR